MDIETLTELNTILSDTKLITSDAKTVRYQTLLAKLINDTINDTISSPSISKTLSQVGLLSLLQGYQPRSTSLDVLTGRANLFASNSNQGFAYLPSPITIAHNATNPNTQLDFFAGNFNFSDRSGQALLTSNLTKKLDASWVAGSGNGGLFFGNKAINTWYYPFAIYNPTTGVSDAGFDISPNGVNIPSGFTKRSNNLQPIRTNPSGNIIQGSFLPDGSFYFNTINAEETLINATGGGNYTLSYVPPIPSYAILFIYCQSDALNAYPHYYVGLSASNFPVIGISQLNAGNARANGIIPTSNAVIYREYGGAAARLVSLYTNGFRLQQFNI